MIKVLIQRDIAETLEAPYEQIARRVLSAAIQSPGFISGESFRDIDNPNRRVIMVTWQNIHSWQRWEASEERRSAISDFAPILLEEERITVLEPL
ncbi:MAG: antibiotic biosynthesis monooxygenase family protein [Pseudomonadaceae bacterium]